MFSNPICCLESIFFIYNRPIYLSKMLVTDHPKSFRPSKNPNFPVINYLCERGSDFKYVSGLIFHISTGYQVNKRSNNDVQ